MKQKIHLTGVNETMLMPVYARALESKRKKPAFYDETAVRTVESLDYNFEQHGKSKMNVWGCISRAIILDREAAAYIAEHPDCSVVNLACGLDDRFSRVDNGKITWYNIDLENVMEIRKTIVPVKERAVEITCSILDFDWIQKIKNKENVLIIAEGILPYLEEEDVKKLFRATADSFKNCTCLLEFMTSYLVAHQNTHDTIKITKAVFRFGVKKSEDFTKLCPMYRMTGDFNLTDIMKRYSPVFLTIIDPMLRPRNNRIARFEKTEAS